MPKDQQSALDSDSTNSAVTRRRMAYYDDITQMSIPDRFTDLLEKLDAA